MDTGAWTQIIAALVVGLGVFIALYLLPHRWTLTVLVLLIPFQIINSRYGSINIVLTYMLAISLLLQHRLNKLPLIGIFILIGFAYILSMSQVPGVLRFESLLYLINVSAGFMMFYVVYNMIRTTRDIHYFITLLISINAMVTLYCYIQLVAGEQQIAFLGVDEFALIENRITEQDRRLAGPFSAVGITAEFFVLQILLMCYLVMHQVKRGRRWLFYGLISANLAFLVATGNRGGVISLVLGAILMLYAFRKELGPKRLLVASLGGLSLSIITGVVVIQTTEFNRLYERFISTEFRGVMPETRSWIWTESIERIAEKPVIGHGPRVQFDTEIIRQGNIEWISGHPHNLYLFLLYTLGIVGLIAYLTLFASIFLRLWQARRYRVPDKLIQGLPKLGVVLLVVFLFDQIKVEFLRFTLADYQQYMFLLWGFLLAAAAVLRQEARASQTMPSMMNGSVNEKAGLASTPILRQVSRRMPK